MKRISLIVLFAGILTASAAFAQTNTPPNFELVCQPQTCVTSLVFNDVYPSDSSPVAFQLRLPAPLAKYDNEDCPYRSGGLRLPNCKLECKWEGSIFTSSETVYSKDNCSNKMKQNFRSDETIRFYMKDLQGLVASDSVFVDVSPDIPASIKNIGEKSKLPFFALSQLKPGILHPDLDPEKCTVPQIGNTWCVGSPSQTQATDNSEKRRTDLFPYRIFSEKATRREAQELIDFYNLTPDVMIGTYPLYDYRIGNVQGSSTHTITLVNGAIYWFLFSYSVPGIGAQYKYIIPIEPFLRNEPPTINGCSLSPTSGKAPLTVIAAVSATDPEGDAIWTAWNFGDASGSYVVPGKFTTYTYKTAGTYTGRVYATDTGSGQVSPMYVCPTVTVTNSASVVPPITPPPPVTTPPPGITPQPPNTNNPPVARLQCETKSIYPQNGQVCKTIARGWAGLITDGTSDPELCSAGVENPGCNFTRFHFSSVPGDSINRNTTGKESADNCDGASIATIYAPDQEKFTFYVTDDRSQTASASVLIDVINPVLIADFTWSPASPVIGQVVAFQDRSTPSEDATIVSQRWDLNGAEESPGDRYESSGSNPAFVYTKPGQITANFVVTDSNGMVKTKTKTVTIGQPAPLAGIRCVDNEQCEVHQGQSVVLDAGLSTDAYDCTGLWPNCSAAFRCSWGGAGALFGTNCAGGVIDTSGIVGSSRQYQLTVTNSGGLAHTVSKTITLLPALGNPVARISCVPGSCTQFLRDSAITMSAAGSTDPDNCACGYPNSPCALTCLWSGQGVTWDPNSCAGGNLPLIVNNYPITLKVADPRGATDAVSLTARVTRDVTADFLCSSSGAPGSYDACGNMAVDTQTELFFKNNSTLSEGATGFSRVEWNFGDGTTLSNIENPSHLFAGSGDVVVTLWVEDTNGRSHQAQKALEVDLPLPVYKEVKP